MRGSSDDDSSGEYFVPPFKNQTEKQGIDAVHSIEGVRSLFMMHEAMSELRSELLKKDQELLALKRDLEKERSRGQKLASTVGALRKTVFPAEGSVISSVSSPQVQGHYRHSCSASYSINRGSSGYGSEARIERAMRKPKTRCVKRGVWEVAALSRYFSKNDARFSSLPDVSVDEGETEDEDDTHSTCSTTSLIAAAESFKAVSHWASDGKINCAASNDVYTNELVCRENALTMDIPVMPRKWNDILPGSRVKYFHPNGRVCCGVAVQVGSMNPGEDVFIWCTREDRRASQKEIVTIPWRKILVCFRKQYHRSMGE